MKKLQSRQMSVSKWKHYRSLVFSLGSSITWITGLSPYPSFIHTYTQAPFWSYDNLVGDYFSLYRNLKNLEQWFSALAARITQALPPEFYLIGLWWSPSNIISLKLIKCSQYSTRVVGHGPRAIVLQQALKDLQKHRLLTRKFLIQ